jgi:hypothetical protein
MRKLITHNKYNKKKTTTMSCLFLMTALIMGSALGMIITPSAAMGEEMKKFKKDSGDSARMATLAQHNLNFAIPNSDANGDTNVDVGEEIVISGDNCGVHDEDSGSSYPVDCNTGEPL